MHAHASGSCRRSDGRVSSALLSPVDPHNLCECVGRRLCISQYILIIAYDIYIMLLLLYINTLYTSIILYLTN